MIFRSKKIVYRYYMDIDSKNIFLDKAKLTKKERKYCSCLMKVRGKSYQKTKKITSPYAICTNSLYNREKKKRNKIVKCSKYYKFKNYSLQYLQAYALEKKIPIKSKSRKAYSKSILLKKIIKYKKIKPF